MGGEEKKKLIKLYCPSMAKIVRLLTWEEQKLDLGYIARAFGLDPASVKINGHFIARGVDFVASSVTWMSLFSFFSARGLSTGSSESDAITVDGKLSKLGCKRLHDPTGPENGALVVEQVSGISSPSKMLQLGDTDLVCNKRLKDSNAVPHKTTGTDKINAFSCPRMKRKSLFGDIIPMKRERINSTSIGLQERKDDPPKTILDSKYPCSYINESMKRLIEEDIVTSLAKG